MAKAGLRLGRRDTSPSRYAKAPFDASRTRLAGALVCASRPLPLDGGSNWHSVTSWLEYDNEPVAPLQDARGPKHRELLNDQVRVVSRAA